jgi:molybdopterin-containing oxidoreductase family iron-sulfur binding subunit
MSSMNKDPKPTHWRSLAELGADPKFNQQLDNEFAEPVDELDTNGTGRRTFLQVMGASMALAGATTGCRWERDEILPLSQRPEALVPGEPRQYVTSIELDGVAGGLLVTTVDGRPIKVDGNPKHPESQGAATIYQQASLLDLYDPDRSQDVALNPRQRAVATWESFASWATAEMEALRGTGGAGLAFLLEPTLSPTVARLQAELAAIFPKAIWASYSVNHRDAALEGANIAFGRKLRTVIAYERARVILSLDADPLSPTTPRSLLAARSIVAAREPELRADMNRIYAVESSYSLIGTLADHRLPLRSSDVLAFVSELDALITAKGGTAPGVAQPRPKRDWLEQPKPRAFIDALVTDLLAARGASAIVVGEHQPPEVHAIVHRLNALLGNINQTIHYLEEPNAALPSQAQQLRELVAGMRDGRVTTLFILGANPVVTAPVDLEFAQALGKVTKSVHLSYYENETSAACQWHLPQAHALESWGDARAYDGTIAIAQPMIQPLYAGRTAAELLAFLQTGNLLKGYDLLRRTHAGLSDAKMRVAIQTGIVAGTAFARVAPELKPLTPLVPVEEVSPESLELVLSAASNLHDGRFANNAWLIELPDPITKVTWDNPAWFAPKTAERLGITDGDVVEIQADGRKVSCSAVVVPGQAEGSIRLALGWGRTEAGRVGGSIQHNVAPVGTNAYALRTEKFSHVIPNVTATRTGKKQLMASTQDLHAIDQRGREGIQARLGMIVREATLEEFRAKPDFVQEAVHHPPLLQMWKPPVSYDGHRWGMSIDMTKCIGCNACMVACQAENNVPVVGKEAVSRGREMHWIRVDRYFTGTPDEPSVSFQPLPCQHCENAPCEQVCPVGATMHSSEGLNDMTYNRCIGTRYCSNNCPYKVRRFNYFNYHLELKKPDQQIRKMVFNPDVTVRFRGVMEKCTFCVQRIQRTKIQSKNDRRPIKDGEIKTACQQACPTDVIVFGDLNDKSSRVARLQERSRSYALLEELNNRPRIQYLARIRNPNPKLV